MGNFNELINGETPVLVDFFATWCGPCKTMSPILDEVKSEVGESVKIIKVDVDKNPNAATHYGIRGVPTLVLFHRGRRVWSQSGVVPKQQLLQLLRDQVYQ